MATSRFPSGGGGTPGGSDTQVQFNDSGAFGGSGAFIFNKSGTGSQYAVVSALTGPMIAVGVDDVNGRGSRLVLGSNHDNASPPEFRTYSSNGTNASPVVDSIGDALYVQRHYGFDGTSFIPGANITYAVAASPSSGHVPMSYLISLDDGSSTGLFSLNPVTGILQWNKATLLFGADTDISRINSIGNGAIEFANSNNSARLSVTLAGGNATWGGTNVNGWIIPVSVNLGGNQLAASFVSFHRAISDPSGSLATDDGNTSILTFEAYDVDGAAYKTFATLTNGNTPNFTISQPSGGILAVIPPTSDPGVTGAIWNDAGTLKVS